MIPDPLQVLIDGHDRVSEWLDTMWNAMGLLEGDTPTDLLQLQAFFRVHVREHFEFEERLVFPALLEADDSPGTRALIEELQADHVRILAACGKLFIDLAWCMTAEDTAEHVRAVKGRARELIEAVLAHAGHEDEALLPLMRTHRVALAKCMAESESAKG